MRYAELHTRTHSVSQIGEVMTAMRGVAAARAQQSRLQLGIVQKYADVVAATISQILAMTPALPESGNGDNGKSVLILFCAEHGFAGAFSEKILDAAGVDIAGRTLLIVGTRGDRLARERGLLPAWSEKLMAQLSNAGALADRIATQLHHHLHDGVIRHAEMIYARPLLSAGFEIIRQQLLPFDFGRFAPQTGTLPPLLNLPAAQLLAQLAQEYLFAQLNEAIVHSYAAENMARLQTMTAAREHIHHQLEVLSSQEQQARQSEITAEIIELVAGSSGRL